jgi:hypothetical protein
MSTAMTAANDPAEAKPAPPRPGRYTDPLDVLWLSLAQRLGLRVVRSHAVFASWDGVSTLTLAEPGDFDPDDSLTQLILHEICHALVEGPEALSRPDWGLCNHTLKDLVREHACHRVQAALLEAHDLRQVFGPTTEHRPYYDGLPEDPLAAPAAGEPEDPALAPARAGYKRARGGPWSAPLEEALRATRIIVELVRPHAAADSVFARR